MQLNCAELSKKIGSSKTVTSFVNFINYLFPNSKIVFVVHELDKLIESVYWSLESQEAHQDFYYISLSGNLMKVEEGGGHVEMKKGVLEENSSKNLINLFTADAIEAAISSSNDPLRNLVESLVMLAQVNLSKNELISCGDKLEIYFTSSILIGGKIEYPLYILDKKKIDVEEILATETVEEAAELVHRYYDDEALESEVFRDSRIFERFSLLSNEAISNIDESGLKFEDLIGDEEIKVDLDGIRIDFEAAVKEIETSLTPSDKLMHLSEFYSKLSAATAINADVLLPILTILLVQSDGKNIVDQIRFIEKFAHPSQLTGANNYILTSMNAAIEVIKTLDKGKETSNNDESVSMIPSSPSHFSSFISSITSVPRTLVSNIGLIGRTSIINSGKSEARHGDLTFEMTEFREKMMATNSEKDLSIRDISLLLEDYKNLLFKIFKSA